MKAKKIIGTILIIALVCGSFSLGYLYHQKKVEKQEADMTYPGS